MKAVCHSVHIGYDVINILGVKLYIEVCKVLNSCCDSMPNFFQRKYFWEVPEENTI